MEIYHIYNRFLSAIPAYIMSLFEKTTNLVLGTDYMFFKCNSFFLVPMGAALHDTLTFVIVYIVNAVFCALPYLIAYSMKKNRRKNQYKR